ncbi:MAG: FtsW/RodA/SpoVE family cell cycle protein [Ruminococcus flavefaciens]|nr:FtsW/RodA/SpoVE family cell cycle protein [Ruminococcus flavefaciens]MCM1360311.1 FtsW/RodA/SpoVE family cell cycle protein [Clostridiales bacterium]MCM1435540.1 FtsW/RodA/SpoVE family cell cycle protein [Ruminococcus flavefaciens]
MKSAFKKLSVNKHNIDAGLMFAVTLCAAISTLLIYSISESGLSANEGVGSSYWKTQLFSMIIGIGAAIIISLIDYRKLVKLWFIFAPAALFLVALTFTSLGYQRAGADDQAWLQIGPLNFQPSEVLKIAFILTFGYHLSRDEENMNKPLHMLLLLIHGAVPIAIVGKQGDYGTAIVFAAIFGFMICSAKISWKYLIAAPFVIAAAVAGMWFFALNEFHKKRILILFNPGTDADIEYQQNLGLAALKSGGVFGKGLMKNADEYVYVPEIHNDFIFTYAGQVFGFVGSIGLLIILAYICLKIFADSHITRDRLGRFICMGAFGLMLSHCILNIGMVLKVAPVIGIPLPFLSAGGTAMVSMYAIIGLVLSTYSHRAVNYNVFYDDNEE